MGNGAAKRVGKVIWSSPTEGIRAPQHLRAWLHRTYVTADAVCSYCGSVANLSVDHIIRKTWAKGFNPNATENLQVLCISCHRAKYGEEERVQSQVMMGRITIAEAFDKLRALSPYAGTNPKPKNLKGIMPESKWLWRHQKSFYVKVGCRIIGVTFFAKKLRRQ